jgi:glycyl-tRNA synthetase beta chain
MRGSDNFCSLATSFKRIKNIVIKAGLTAESEFPVSLELFQESEEQDLYSSISRISPLVNRFRKKSDFKKIFELLASLRPQIDRFFDKVLVMAEDPRIQQNRLSLLGSLWKLFLGVADISEIVIS